ncbi:SCO4848 family membrane protein [Micromonospora mangrovi]|uniref:Integral membrane protein n=2 Tax=Micromonospora TaxID=1873 RepID=A0AAU8HE93_9ACTN
MVLSRGWSLFLVGVGVWTWVIWPRFALAIWDDPRAWSTGTIGVGSPTAFLWVHALLIAASLAIGTTVGVLGIRGSLAARRRRRRPAEDAPRVPR